MGPQPFNEHVLGTTLGTSNCLVFQRKNANKVSTKPGFEPQNGLEIYMSDIYCFTSRASGREVGGWTDMYVSDFQVKNAMRPHGDVMEACQRVWKGGLSTVGRQCRYRYHAHM